MLDAHCHFWRLDRGDYDWLQGEGGPLAPIRRDFLPADYPGTGPCIAVQAAASLAETDWLLNLAQLDPRILGVVGWVDLASQSAVADLTARAAHPQLRGIRPMLQDIPETDWLLRAARPEALAAIRELGLCFDALVTKRHLPMLSRFCAKYPDLRVIIDHAAKPQQGELGTWRTAMADLARHPQIYCKISGLWTELPAGTDPLPAFGAIITPLLDLFGPERLIWGSDWPVLTLAGDYENWLAMSETLFAGLTQSEKAAIFGATAARVYGVGHG